MATITTETVVDRMELAEDGSVSLRLATYYDVDGTRDESTKKYHRSVYSSGMTLEEVTAQLTAIKTATSFDIDVDAIASRIIAMQGV